MWRTSSRPCTSRCRQGGAVLVFFAVGLLSLFLFMGLAIDVGMAYMGRAALAKGADSAALMGVRSLSQGEATAAEMAVSTFDMNYAGSHVSRMQARPPTVAVTFPTDSDGNRSVNVVATGEINTWFLRLLPGFDTFDFRAEAQAARARLVMGLGLDRSGSMNSNGGADALPGAVDAFISFFDDASDMVALSTFASHASLDFPIGHDFKSPIINRANSMPFGGVTFADGSLVHARQQVQSISVAPGENVIKAIVFFTDGYTNTFQDVFECDDEGGGRGRGRGRDGPPFGGGGGDDDDDDDGEEILLNASYGDDDDDFYDPEDGDQVECEGVDEFTSIDGSVMQRNATTVRQEARLRAEATAEAAREDGIFVYSIGLGNDLDAGFLRRIANDPTSSTFKPNQPQGVAAIAPSAAELDEVFRQIAAKILLRLTL